MIKQPVDWKGNKDELKSACKTQRWRCVRMLGPFWAGLLVCMSWCKGFIIERRGSGWMVLKGVFRIISVGDLG